jgi:hypothetical protein
MVRFRRTLTVTTAVAATTLGTAALVGFPATSALAATTSVQLPISQYSHMLVDPAHKHIFITSGTGYSTILVTNYSGQTVATITDEPGATGLALSGNGKTVYAALADGDAVSAISTSTLTQTALYSTGAGTDPTYVAYTSGRIWFGYGAAAQGGIGSINPSTSPATVTLNATNDPANTWYAAPMLSASQNGDLVAGEPSQSPVQLASYDVSSGTATVLAPSQFITVDGTSASNMGAMQITPDGTDVVVASGYPYFHQILQVSNLSEIGQYPTTTYPSSVSISRNGTVAAGTDAGSNEVFVFAAGGSTPLKTYDFGSNWLTTDGVAITPNGHKIFAITSAGPYGADPTLNIITRV